MPRHIGTKNLNPVRTEIEAKEKGKVGGIKSGIARKEKATTRELAKIILSGNIPGKTAEDLVQIIGVPVNDRNLKAAILAGQALEAIKGNTRAAEYLIELSGEQTSVEAGQDKKHFELPARALGSEWVDVNRSIDKRDYLQYDFRGGRGSCKSSFCALKIIELIMQDDKLCALAVRELKDDIQPSVYSQIIWAIDELGLTDEFHCTKSPIEIKRKSTGQIIYFRAGNEPSKIKSIRPPNGMNVGVVLIEEADQIGGDEALRNILQSAFRGQNNNNALIFRAYNPPISQLHFINVDARKENPRRFIHHSYYYNAPPEWLGKSFFEIAEHLKETNERAYRHEYLGEATGTGANVFENVTLKEITDDEIKRFDKLYLGLDFGFYPDPAAFIACYYYKANRTLYIFDELKRYKTGNIELAKELKAKWDRASIIADSAEPKSVKELNDLGLNVYGAEKGPGSVEYGMKWLASLNEIVIDNKRCPNAANEFLTYEYERNKNGEIISGYPDANNHFLDAARYSMERESKQNTLYISNVKFIK